MKNTRRERDMAREFDGTNDDVDWGDNTSYETSPLSINAWVMNNNVTADHAYIGKFSANSKDYILFMDLSGPTHTVTYEFFTRAGSSELSRVSTGTNSAVNDTWQHLVGTYLFNDSEGVDLFLDGVEQGNSPVDTTNQTADTVGQNTLSVINGIDSASGKDHDGKIGEIAIWQIRLNDNHKLALSHGVPALVVSGTKPTLYSPLWGNESPEPNWGTVGGTGTVTGATKAANNPPVELLENYL